MKSLFSALSLCFCFTVNAQRLKQSQNIFIITTDGLRWQEVFNGADPSLIKNTMYVADTGLLQQQYGDTSTTVGRKKLMPFFWNVIAEKGQLYGNRAYDNKMNVSNFYKISYPGYSEMLTGYPDKKLVLNSPKINRNINVLEYLNAQDDFKGKVVAFSSWNIFPYILNENRSNFSVNSGYEALPEDDSTNLVINEVQNSVHKKTNTRYDLLTFLAAKEYITQHHPKVMMLGLGETDKFAHEGKYDQYLQQINNADKMIAELWYMVQTDPFYKNNTTFIITTDHGRGRKSSSWYKHHLFVKGSGEVWMALLGPQISPEGEMKTEQQVYLKQVAATVAMLLGQDFKSNHKAAAPVNLPGVEHEQIISASITK